MRDVTLLRRCWSSPHRFSNRLHAGKRGGDERDANCHPSTFASRSLLKTVIRCLWRETLAQAPTADVNRTAR
jgi:hypothetical protein